MPRKARIVLPNYPHHIVQRGHNRQPVFADASDYQHYLGILQTFKQQLGCKVYGYCLMTNHVHLVVDPGEDTRALGWLMKRIAARQTRLVNRIERRTGSLWEGRYKSTPIDTDQYLLACCRYVELNPVRASMVRHPCAYRWSSYQQKVGLAEWGWLDPDPCYLQLGETPDIRQSRYSAFVGRGVSQPELSLFQHATQRGQLAGGSRFVDKVESMLAKRVEYRGPGRPTKNEGGDRFQICPRTGK